MNSKNYQIGHRADIPKDWLPKLKPPTPPTSNKLLLSKKSDKKSDDEEKHVENETKIKGSQHTMSIYMFISIHPFLN